MIDLNALSLPELFDALTSDGSLERLLEAARREDLGDEGDVTTAAILDGGWTVRATGAARAAGVVSGLPAISRLLRVFECHAKLDLLAADGGNCEPGDALWRLQGELAPILGAERTMLNLVGRLSGVATLTAQFVDAVSGTSAVVCDTRKTTPGLRGLEKYAVRCGGGTLHRLGLHDAVLLKDNHLAHLGPSELGPAVTRAAERARAGHDLRFVEVEVDDLEQLRAVLGCPVDIVLLDNLAPAELREAVAIRDRRAPGIMLEASGGVRLETVRAVAESGVDRVAVGAITHSAPSLDIGLDVS